MAVLPLALLVTIRLYDSSGMPAADLQAAMLTANAALRTGQVAAAWVVCPPPGAAPAPNSSGCTGLPHESDLLVRIVRAPDAFISADTLGFAAVDTTAGRGSLATVFADRIVRLAARSRIDAATLVGYAIAHEIGHLLLGTDAHAPRGLMRAAWTLPEMTRRLPTDWRFSRSDAAQLVGAAERSERAQERAQSVRADRSRDASDDPMTGLGADPQTTRTSSTATAESSAATVVTLRSR
jgi:hypothetical protein